MKREDNQHRNKAIKLLDADIILASADGEVFCRDDSPAYTAAKLIVDAIMDAVQLENGNIAALLKIPIDERTPEQVQLLISKYLHPPVGMLAKIRAKPRESLGESQLEILEKFADYPDPYPPIQTG